MKLPYMKYLSLVVSVLLLSYVANAALPPILGPSTLCTGSSTTLTNSVTGGTWTSGSPGVASIGASSGLVSGISVGTAVITYTDGIDFAYSTITVNPSPSAITGSTVLCVGSSGLLSATPSGGFWSSSNPSIGTIAITGSITGISGGTTTITYTVAGCFSSVIVSVNNVPIISTPSTVCIGSSSGAIGTPSGGTWSSSAPGTATIDAGGTVTPIAPGTTTISYRWIK